MQTTLACTCQIPLEIFNLQYQFSKLTLKSLIHGWSKNNGLVFKNDKLFNVLITSKRTIYDRIYLMKSNGKSIKQKPTLNYSASPLIVIYLRTNRSIL